VSRITPRLVGFRAPDLCGDGNCVGTGLGPVQAGPSPASTHLFSQCDFTAAGFTAGPFFSLRICSASSRISVKSRCISLQPYHSA